MHRSTKLKGGLAALTLGVYLLMPFAAAAAVTRDSSSNAMITGGATTRCQLSKKLRNGDGTHSAAELQQTFASLGVQPSDWGSCTQKNSSFVEGVVTKDGRVMVPSSGQNGGTGMRVVATNAFSYGHAPLKGSTKVGSNLYKRPTSVSFTSGSQQAWVFMPNGQFKYAIIESCGNLVTATPKAVITPQAAPTPQPAPAPAPVTNTNINTNVVQVHNTVAPAPKPTPAPAPALPQTGAAGFGLAGFSSLLTVGWYYLRSRRWAPMAAIRKAVSA